MIIKDAEIEFVCGRRGCGKSTLVKRLIKDRPRLLAIDPTGEYSAESTFTKCLTVDELKAAVRRKKGHGRFALKTADPDMMEAAISDVLIPWNRDYDRHGQKVCLVIEEANIFYDSKDVRRRPNLTGAILQGRHWGCEILAVTQRPGLVSPNLRGQARTWYVFALDYEDDRREILNKAGREYGDQLRKLEPHTYFLIRDGQVTLDRNPPLRGRRKR